MNILMVVKHRGGESGISQVGVSNQLIVTPSNMTKMIDKLEKKGLVRRTALPGDRRVRRVKVTQAGSELLDSLWPGYLRVLQQLVAAVPQKKQRQLAVLLTEWLEKMER
ncbi:MAG: MarR family transcriptional regulator [Candidatus Omnitrophica bacterium]|nr:MarR family transcriptional regulator [Candidatus Omnitrophota bacterium]